MTMRDAYKLADRHWTDENTVALLRRGRKSPHFAVGYVTLSSGRTKIVGASNVDWESAFWNAGINPYSTR